MGTQPVSAHYGVLGLSQLGPWGVHVSAFDALYVTLLLHYGTFIPA